MTTYNLQLHQNGFSYFYRNQNNVTLDFSPSGTYSQSGPMNGTFTNQTTTQTIDGNDLIYTFDQHQGFIRRSIVNGNYSYTYEGTFPLLKRRDIVANIYTLTGTGDVKKGQIGNYYAAVDIINTGTSYSSFRIFPDESTYNNSLNAGNGQESNYLSWIGLDVSLIQANTYITSPSLLDGTIYKITNNFNGTITVDDSYVATPNPNPQPNPDPQPVQTADIETDANLTSDILRTDPEGKKYYFAKAFTINGSNGITVSTGDQEINLEFDQTLLANFLTSSDITSFLTEAQVQALLTGFLTNADIANFITQEAVQTLVANFLTANDLSSLTNDVITSGVVKGDILKVNTHIEFADGSIIKSVPQV